MEGVYPYVKFVHVVLAIIAVGFNASYGIWLARAAREPEHLGHVLRGIKILDDRVANPAYGLLFLTGAVNVLISGVPFTTPWIAGGIALWAVAIIVGLAVYTPTLRRQIAVLDASGPRSEEFARLSARGRVVGIALGVIVLAIVFLMVVKPGA